MNQEAFIKALFLKAQNNYVWYKNELEATYKDRVNFPPTDELAQWYKELLKEWRTEAKMQMSRLEDELEHIRQGLNPPYCYNSLKPKDKRDLV